jgi:hypothetical protein
MLDQLINLVKKYASEAINNDPAISNEKNEAVIEATSGSIFNNLKTLFEQGNIRDLLKMFTGQGDSGSLVKQQVSGGVMQDLVNQFGLPSTQAQNVANKVVPNVLDEMVQKTNDPNDNSFDIQDIFNNLSGGRTAGFNLHDLQSKLMGGKLDIDGDGDTDLRDLIALSKGGNLMEKIKGLFS